MRNTFLYFSLIFFSYFPLYAQDTTDGIVWEPPIQLTDTSYSAYEPRIALSGNDTIHVTWKEDFTTRRIPYRRCTNGYWEPVMDLIRDTVTYLKPFKSNIVIARGQKVYLFSANELESQVSGPREITMHISSDGGTTWLPPKWIGSDSSNGLFSANIHNDTLVVVYAPYKSGYSKMPMMIVSIDSGNTWTKRPDTLDGWTRTALTPGTLHLVRDVFVNGAQEKLYLRSTDLGNTWEKAETLSTVDGYFADEHCIATNNLIPQSPLFVAWRDEIACAGMVGCTIISRESYANGNQWTSQAILTEEPRGYNPAAAISENGVTAVAWTSEQLFVNDHVVTRIRKHRDSVWSPIIDHTPLSRVGGLQQVAVTGKAVHLVWTQSIGQGAAEKFCTFYRRGVFLQTDVKENQEANPNEYSLSQNYPNPFNPQTTISFDLPHAEHVLLKVYNVFGQEVATLVDEKKEAGKHRIEWNADKYPSGVYFYRIISGQYVETKKAILMK